jgi:PKD repeat protein
MAAFQLYNPTTGTGGVQSGGVKYAEAIEFDHTGEYILYDAYNVVGSSLGGAVIDYWDMGLLHVWNNNANSFGSGQISKLFSALEQGVSVGNPTFSKNSPHIIAFDYMDKNGNFATFGLNMAEGKMNMMFANSTTSFPSYSMNDDMIAFASFNSTPFAGYAALGVDKISVSGQGNMIANYSTFPIFYGTGTRQLGIKPTAAFSVDVREGGIPLMAQFVDLSENSPTSWDWTFQGGTPSTSSTQHPKVTYSIPGTYSVKLVATNAYGSHEMVKQAYISVGTTGIDLMSQQPLQVYCNPAGDELIIDAGKSALTLFTVYDLAGKKTMTGKLIAGRNYLNISALPCGLYFVKTGDKTAKFIKITN